MSCFYKLSFFRSLSPFLGHGPGKIKKSFLIIKKSMLANFFACREVGDKRSLFFRPLVLLEKNVFS